MFFFGLFTLSIAVNYILVATHSNSQQQQHPHHPQSNQFPSFLRNQHSTHNARHLLPFFFFSFLQLILLLFFTLLAVQLPNLSHHRGTFAHTHTQTHHCTSLPVCAVQFTRMYNFDLLLMLSHRSALLLRLPFSTGVITMERTFSMKSI